MNTTPRRDSYDVVVIGAGPAGLAAAATAAEAGLSTLLLDENAGPGGQVWRAIASTPVTERDHLGVDYWAGADLVQAVRSSDAEIIQRATVWSLDRNLEVGVSVGGVVVLRQGASCDSGDGRARAAVSDSRLDASGSDDRRRRADDAEVLRRSCRTGRR